MDITIERVRPGDEGSLAFIQTESWKAAYADILDSGTLAKLTDPEKSRAMFKNMLENRIGNGYLLQINGWPQCMAYWDASRETDMPGYAELISIYSLPESWGKGIGRMMMERVLEDITKAGYEKVMLWTFEKNTRARKFYEKTGFTLQGKSKPFRDQIEICYEKQLALG